MQFEDDGGRVRTASVNEHTPALPAEGTPERAALEARYPLGSEPGISSDGDYERFLRHMVEQEHANHTQVLRELNAPALFCLTCRPGALDGYEDVSREAFLNTYDAAEQFVPGVTHLHPSRTSLIAYAQKDNPDMRASRLFACPCGSGEPARHVVHGPFTLRWEGSGEQHG